MLDGKLDGLLEGRLEVDGLCDGLVGGLLVGSVEGMLEGSVEGVLEGSLEGSLDGSAEAMLEGSLEGSLEGTLEGTHDGSVEARKADDGQLGASYFDLRQAMSRRGRTSPIAPARGRRILVVLPPARREGIHRPACHRGVPSRFGRAGGFLRYGSSCMRRT